MLSNYSLQTLRNDVFGGFTAMVVALPVAVAFGVASGMGPAAGLYGAVAVGFIAPLFRGTSCMISGPSAPMAVAMAVVVASHADHFGEVITIVVMAGLLQVALGLSGLGRFVAYTPHVVVSGFMSGIGITVIIMQSLPFFGEPVAGGEAVEVMNEWMEMDEINHHAAMLAAFTLAVAVLWPNRLRAFVPAPVAALVAGTLVGVNWLPDAPVIGDMPEGLPAFQMEFPTAKFLADAWHPAILLALIGSLDSLLVSLVAVSMTRSENNPSRELIGQGCGNMVSGMFGGMPCAGSPIFTLTNIRVGGRTPVSCMIYAGLILALLLGLGHFVAQIPHAVLAGVLIKVGWDIIDWHLLKRMHRLMRVHLVVMLATLLCTVFVDLITAVAIGLIAGGMTHARLLEGLELDSVISVPLLNTAFLQDGEVTSEEDRYAAQVGLVKLRGMFTVASAHKLSNAIGEDIKDHEVVIFDFSDTNGLDDSAAMVFLRILEIAVEEDTAVIVSGLRDEPMEILTSLDILASVPENNVVDSMEDARTVAVGILKG